MALRYALLGLLTAGPASGYDLTKRFDRSVGYAWHAGHSQIYPEMAKLCAAGLVEVAEEGGPRGRKTYTITGAGLAALRAWLLDTEPDRRHRSEATLRLFMLPLLDRADAAALIAREREYATAKLAELEQRRAEIADACSPFRYAVEHGIRHSQATLDWADWADAHLP
jgi:PadR family transcriptional regulator, regulatory protein AphA